jgi:hypothetical protein
MPRSEGAAGLSLKESVSGPECGVLSKRDGGEAGCQVSKEISKLRLTGANAMDGETGAGLGRGCVWDSE